MRDLRGCKHPACHGGIRLKENPAVLAGFGWAVSFFLFSQWQSRRSGSFVNPGILLPLQFFAVAAEAVSSKLKDTIEGLGLQKTAASDRRHPRDLAGRSHAARSRPGASSTAVAAPRSHRERSSFISERHSSTPWDYGQDPKGAGLERTIETLAGGLCDRRRWLCHGRRAPGGANRSS